MPEGHPIITVYAQTAQADFPLILAVGREANNTGDVGNWVGPYDFRLAPHCGFWNTSYSLVARLVGSTPARLKQDCLAKHGSPLIYADALPRCLPHRAGNKHQLRAALSDTDVRNHIDNLFAHTAIIQRVRLVLLSGLSAPYFAVARTALAGQCAARRIPVVAVPFFYGSNKTKIDDAIDAPVGALIHAIMQQFYSAHMGARSPQ